MNICSQPLSFNEYFIFLQHKFSCNGLRLYKLDMIVTSKLPCMENIYTVEPRLSKPLLSETSVIRMLFQILKSQKIIWFSTKPSNKWQVCVIFRLATFIISQYGGKKSILASATLSAAHAID